MQPQIKRGFKVLSTIACGKNHILAAAQDGRMFGRSETLAMGCSQDLNFDCLGRQNKHEKLEPVRFRLLVMCDSFDNG